MSGNPVDALEEAEAEGEEDGPRDLVAPVIEEEQVGRRIGKYELVAELGHGGMAIVFLARASGPHGFTRWFAIKRIHPHLARDERFVNMFLDEARIASALHHANVAQVIELGQDDRSYFLVMEYLHGEHLGTIVRRSLKRRGQSLSLALSAHVVACAAEGLHHAHEATDANGVRLELVHRDVSPHNIFVTYDGQVKITDFGIAKAAGRLTHTQTGGLKGKLSYMSPEQVGRHEVDRRSDIFALGIVLYECSTGKRLFRAPSEVQTIMRITSGRIPRPSADDEDYPPRLEEIVLRALSRNPDDRYQSAGALAEDLRAFVATEADGATAPQDLVSTMAALFEESRSSKEAWQRKPAMKAGEATDTELDGTTAARRASEASETSRVRPKPSKRRIGAWLAALTVLVAGGAAFATFSALEPAGSEPAREAMAGPGERGTDESPASPEPELAAVRIDTEPTGGDVRIDGISHGAAPVLIEDVALGEHTLEITLAGHETLSQSLDVDEAREAMHFTLAALDAPGEGAAARPVRGTATLNLVTVPWAKVWLNGDYVGETPIVGRRVPSGRIRLRLQAEGSGPMRTFSYRARPGQVLHKRERL